MPNRTRALATVPERKDLFESLISKWTRRIARFAPITGASSRPAGCEHMPAAISADEPRVDLSIALSRLADNQQQLSATLAALTSRTFESANWLNRVDVNVQALSAEAERLRAQMELRD